MNSIKYEYNTVIGHFMLTNDTLEGFSQDCTVVQRKKRITPIYFNTNYRREMKLVPIIKDYCLL